MHTAIDEYFRTAPAAVCLLPLSEPALNAVLDTIAAEAARWEDDKAAWPQGSTAEALTGLPAAGLARMETVNTSVRAAAAAESRQPR